MNNNVDSVYDVLNINGIVTRSSRPDHSLIICNANLPLHLLQNRNAIEQIQGWLVHHFGEHLNNSSYDLSGAYQLINERTNEIRTWTGSFSPRHAHAFAWSRNNIYQSGTFVNTVVQNTRKTDIENFLQMINPTSAWKFHKLLSVIINFDVLLPNTHPFIVSRQIQHHRNYTTFSARL